MIPQAFIGGFQTVAALAIGVGALATVPLIGTTGSSDQKPNSENDSSSESNSGTASNPAPESDSPLDLGRSVVKNGFVWLFDVMDQTQKFFAESAESFQDLLTEAKIEQQAIAKSREENMTPPKNITPPSDIPIED